MRCVFTAAVGAVLAAAGCAHYDGQPDALGAATVDAALSAPPLDRLKVAAASFEHPLLQPLVIDGRDGFTPEEIAVMTVISSPRLRALRDQRGVAAAQVVQAGLLPNPQLGYTLDQLHGNSDPALINGGSLGLSWELTALLGYRDRVAAARSTARAVSLDIAWQEWQAAQAARHTACRVLSLESRLPLARESEQEEADALALARRAHALGHETTSDLAAVTEAWSAAQDARFALEQELTAGRIALNLGLNQPADAPLRLKAGANPPELSPGAAPVLLEGLEKRRLDLVALALGYESNEASLRAAIKAQFPKIGFSFARTHDTSDVRTHTYGVIVDLPLFDRNQGQIAAGQATRRQLFDDYVARVAEARADVVQILSNLAVARVQLRTLEDELPELEQIAAALDRAMRTRNADAQAWRDAHGALRARRAEQAKLRQDLLELGVALELASGRPLLAARGAN